MALMTKDERMESITMASREDVRFALLDEHASHLAIIITLLQKDNYNSRAIASMFKSRWEEVASAMNDNREMTHMDYAELMASMIAMMRLEFRKLGFSEKEFYDICSELQ